MLCFSTRVFLPQAHPISGRCRFFTIWIEGINMGRAPSDLPFQRTFVYADLFLILFFLPERNMAGRAVPARTTSASVLRCVGLC